MGKWTPGPWSLNDDQRHVGSDGVTLVGEVAKLNPDEFARVAADSRLIAEAPAMAGALVKLIGWTEEWSEISDYPPGKAKMRADLKAARAILARINGDAP